MKCKLTGDEGKPAKAHIIPKSFYRIDYSFKNPLKIITNIEGEYPKRSHSGIYDNSIVTEKGEKHFDPLDDYSCKLLIEDIEGFELLERGGKKIAYYINEYDYAKLKLFFLSLLWRAHSSSHYFFSKVDIGPHEKIIRKAILDNDPGDEEFYSVNLAIFDDMESGAPLMDPFPERFDQIRYFRFYLSNIIAYIKTDKQRSKTPLSATQLASGKPLIILQRSFIKSEESRIARSML